MKGILIDTRIWALGLKFPFLVEEDEDFNLAKIAQKWLKSHLMVIKK